MSSEAVAEIAATGAHSGGRVPRRVAWQLRPALSWTLPLIVVLGACLLHAVRTYDVGFNIGDEGSAILVAQQILAGRQLYREIHSDNNILVPLSLVAVFALFGIDFLVFRLFHLALAALAAVFGYLAVARITGDRRLALLAGVLVGLFPGTLHKTFLPLVVTANLYALSRLDFERPSLPLSALVLPSAMVTVGILTRTDLGWTCFAILNVLLVSHLISQSVAWRAGVMSPVRRLLAYLGVQAGVAGLMILPILVWASVTGVLPDLLQKQGQQLIATFLVIGFSHGVRDADVAARATDSSAHLLLAPPPLSAMLEGGANGVLALFLYGMALVLVVAVTIASVLLATRTLRPGARLSNDVARGWALWVIAVPGFASFALFRPDSAHLSQFMASGIVVIVATIGLLSVGLAPRPTAWRSWPRGLAVAVLGGYLVGYVTVALTLPPLPLFQAKSDLVRYASPDGRIVTHVSAESAAFLHEIVRTVQSESSPGEPVLCFTHCSGVNVLADRPSFLARRYADNATPLKEPHWQAETVAQIAAHRPPVIVLNEYAPNGTEHSRFDVWATDVMAHVNQHYVVRSELGAWRILVRRDDDRP